MYAPPKRTSLLRPGTDMTRLVVLSLFPSLSTGNYDVLFAYLTCTN